MKNFPTKNIYSLKLINLRAVVVALAFLICLLAAQNASAASYVVTRIDDRNNATCAAGDCSLREAVKAANATAVADTITFNIPAASCNASTNVCTITLTTASGGEIAINSAGGALTINGTGANLLTIDGGAGTNRIFYSNAATVTITGVALTGGNGTGAVESGTGGAIYASFGSLTLNSVLITGNSTPALSRGGGVYLSRGGHSIINSTISANTTDNGGGIYSNSANLGIVNSTISGNTANGAGGGLHLSVNTTSTSRINLSNVTITNNTARDGGGIFRFADDLNFGNTIVAGNTATRTGPEIFYNTGTGTVTSQGYNLFGDSAGDSTNTGPNAITYQPTDIQDVNPMLGALQNNGGTMPTHALLANSPAIDKGNSFGSTTDQRGLSRPVDNLNIANATGGDGSDIGAFEAQLAPTAASVSIGGRALTTNGRGIRNVIIRLTDVNGIVRTATTTSFGYYRFADVAAGETYIITATGKRFMFSQPSRILNATGDVDDINFIGYTELILQ